VYSSGQEKTRLRGYIKIDKNTTLPAGKIIAVLSAGSKQKHTRVVTTHREHSTRTTAETVTARIQKSGKTKNI
jgi:hypothetical protein